jgi:hypothetical protein
MLHIVHTANIAKKTPRNKMLQNTLALFFNTLQQTADHSIIFDIICAYAVSKILSRMKTAVQTEDAASHIK